MAHKWDPVCPPPTGLVRPSRLDAKGLEGPTRSQVRGKAWRRTSWGRYLPSSVDGERVEQRVLEQSARLADGSAVTGWASLRLAGANFFDGLDTDGVTRLPVPVALGGRNRIHGDEEVWLSQESLPPDEQVVRHGVPCTTIPRALFDEIRRVGRLRAGIVAAEMAYAARLTSPRLMREFVDAHPATTKVQLVRDVLAWAQEHSRSPQESRMRLVWIFDARLPPPLCNRPVFDLHGRLLGIPDILDPVAGVVGEYDGAEHVARQRRQHDAGRYDRFRAHELEYFNVVAGDLSDRRLVVRRMLATRSRARFLAPGRHPWTLEPPAWWRVRPSLDELLAKHPRR